MIVLIVIVIIAHVFLFALAKSAGLADRRMEEIQRQSAMREAGTANGN